MVSPVHAGAPGADAAITPSRQATAAAPASSNAAPGAGSRALLPIEQALRPARDALGGRWRSDGFFIRMRINRINVQQMIIDPWTPPAAGAGHRRLGRFLSAAGWLRGLTPSAAAGGSLS
ncbi:hypothetical protein [Eleftheria terrae]|uniref:hypothetical protein n=1 Tax=Eleftheria terrae TaxID=1597781 RepID=UPI00263BA7C1|nr:hypothetical protein [Eleftheria terrae]WKB53363.1 hypothetical protein N7L95_02905 [Eleftheria terrae]